MPSYAFKPTDTAIVHKHPPHKMTWQVVVGGSPGMELGLGFDFGPSESERMTVFLRHW